MGRYCFFNTGYEYKFAFALQPSGDILKFGGTSEFVYEGNHKHSWSIVDRKPLLGKLRDYEEILGLPEVDFESYQKDTDGTRKLHQYLYTLPQDIDLYLTYMLGCLIYHQLLYKLDLSCTYES